MPSANAPTEVARPGEVPEAREPGGERGPAEPQQGARRDVLADAGAAGAALVGRGDGQPRDLDQVEVVQQPDPRDARDDVQPAGEAKFVERGRRDHDRENDGDHEAGRDGAADRVQWIHGSGVLPGGNIIAGAGLWRSPAASVGLKNRGRTPIIQRPARPRTRPHDPARARFALHERLRARREPHMRRLRADDRGDRALGSHERRRAVAGRSRGSAGAREGQGQGARTDPRIRISAGHAHRPRGEDRDGRQSAHPGTAQVESRRALHEGHAGFPAVRLLGLGRAHARGLRRAVRVREHLRGSGTARGAQALLELADVSAAVRQRRIARRIGHHQRDVPEGRTAAGAHRSRHRRATKA